MEVKIKLGFVYGDGYDSYHEVDEEWAETIEVKSIEELEKELKKKYHIYMIEGNANSAVAYVY